MLYINKAISSDRRYLRQIATGAFNLLGIATLELEIINISSATESKRIACNLPFENQLFGYIHCCTEININLLLNTCKFHSKFRFIFSLNLSENTQNVQISKANFQNFPGEHVRD